jgi:hypothetical protein
MNASLETGGDQPQSVQSDTGRIRPNAFSWSMTMHLPTLKQTRFRSVSCALSERWMETSDQDKSIRGHSL